MGTAGAPTGQIASSIPSSTAGADSSGATSSAPTTPVIIGGVVGGIAGLSIVVLLFMFLIRWHKRNNRGVRLDTATHGPEDRPDTVTQGLRSVQTSSMTQRRSVAAVPAALASFAGIKRFSQRNDATRAAPPAEGGEKGFYRVSGRKLPSVMQHGGDGYGDKDLAASRRDTQHTFSDASFYSEDFFSPQSPSFPPLHTGMVREPNVPVMRPSPARTPTTGHTTTFSDWPPPPSASFRPPPSPGTPPHSQSIFKEDV